ncbi:MULTISPECIES: phage head closure protein [Clostridium]|jgi:SPP1 family predicted phage head-tail adaptor|uniref:phage head closure protein n=1 Tax=Clostridium TaxID=1485 RepID=UPI000C08A0AB|nr:MULTISPECIES: phage head closure protein [Clostridium]MDU3677784.1 phage head closure protein [Clostridium sp.]DAI19080.1 MAG TPA: head closure knob [Caudoviricetes sp.]
MWQSEVTLISEEYEFDEIGNQIPIPIEEEVFCNVKSISRSEFYNAATTGLKPSLVFKVRIVDYNDQEKVKFEDNEYKIIRTYIVDTENIELTCEKVLGNA